MALLYALHVLADPARLQVGHFNHGWRGKESDADQEFVADWCSSRRIPYHCENLPRVPGASPTDEAFAREQRYRFLGSTAERIGARYLALGHTRDDHVETILHRILRGTGLRGLAGIPRHRVYSEALTIVRPLLHVARSCVLDYLASVQQPYRTDASNLEIAYTRNQIRHELLPRLTQDYNPRVADALLRLSDQASETQTWITQYADAWLAPNVTPVNSDQFELNLLRVDPVPWNGTELILREALISLWRTHRWPLQLMTAEHWIGLTSWLLHTNPPIRRELPGSISVQRFADWVTRSSGRHRPTQPLHNYRRGQDNEQQQRRLSVTERPDENHVQPRKIERRK